MEINFKYLITLLTFISHAILNASESLYKEFVERKECPASIVARFDNDAWKRKNILHHSHTERPHLDYEFQMFVVNWHKEKPIRALNLSSTKICNQDFPLRMRFHTGDIAKNDNIDVCIKRGVAMVRIFSEKTTSGILYDFRYVARDLDTNLTTSANGHRSDRCLYQDPHIYTPEMVAALDDYQRTIAAKQLAWRNLKKTGIASLKPQIK